MWIPGIVYGMPMCSQSLLWWCALHMLTGYIRTCVVGCEWVISLISTKICKIFYLCLNCLLSWLLEI